MGWLVGLARWLAAFAVALGLTVVLGIGAQSHFTLESLGASAGPITMQDRLAMFGADLKGFAPRYAMLVGAASLATYALATVAMRFLPAARWVLAPLAGAGGVLAVIFGLEAAFGQPVLKGAIGPMALLAQALAGAAGGALFALLSPVKTAR